MKTDFSINVQVNLGVTPEIVALVNAILSHRPTIAPTAEEALDGNGQVDNKPEAPPRHSLNSLLTSEAERRKRTQPPTSRSLPRSQPETNSRRQQPTKPMPTVSR